MMKKKGKDTKAHAAADEDAAKHAGQFPTEPVPCLTFDDYQCTGNVQVDFPRLCSLLDIKNTPAVNCKAPAETEGAEQTAENGSRTISWSQMYLHVDLENRSPLSTKDLKIQGWQIDKQFFKVLKKMLPNFSRLQSLHFWQAGLTDQMVMSLSNLISMCSNLRAVYLDGIPLPNQSYHILISEDSLLTHLFLRNNHIGNEGAHLIGSALSTVRTANKNLQFLNLAFNSIGDAGAAYLAQGLRLNRALLYLSLTNNQIGDSGAAQLCKILGEFPLTHEEIVERRKLLAEKIDLNFVLDTDLNGEGLDTLLGNPPVKTDPKTSAKKKETAKKDEKAEKVTTTKDNLKKGAQKPKPKSPETKAPPAKVGKAEPKKKPVKADAQEEKSTTMLAEAEVEEVLSPLLDPSVQCRDGQVFYPGNTTLAYLSLAGNKITEKTLPLFLSMLEQQPPEGGGLLRLCIQRNHFSPDCEIYNKINDLVLLRDPLKKQETEKKEVEESKS